MSYLITINDTSPKHSDIRNPDIHVGNIEVIAPLGLASQVFRAMESLYPSKDVEIVMYAMSKLSDVVLRRGNP